MNSSEIGRPAPTFFETIALPLARDRGLRVAPCYPKKKEIHTLLVPRPLEMLSSDPRQIHEWGEQEPNANVCVYAQQVEGGLCFLDCDKGDIREAYRRETGRDFRTLFVRSSIKDGVEKGHWYFLQTARTRGLAKNISEQVTGGWFSFRVKNYYVVSAGSIHPDTGKEYEIRQDYPVIPMPDDLLDWLQSKVTREPRTRAEVVQRGKIAKGMRYDALISEVGRLWQRGFSRDLTVKTGIQWARETFDLPEGVFDEGLVRKEIEHLVDSYVPGDSQRAPQKLETAIVRECFADITAKPIEWLWPQRIPRAKLTLFVGDPDLGKSTAGCDVVARFTTKQSWPDGTPNDAEPGDVLLLIAEDDPEDTVKPRLLAAGADMKRVHLLRCVRVTQGAKKADRMLALDTDLALLEAELVANPEIKLVVIDPITNYCGKAKINQDQELRTVLVPIKDCAERTNVTFIGLGHFNKRSDVSALHRVGGAVAMSGVARAVWMFTKNPEVEGERLMLLGKGNLTKRRTGLRYRIMEKVIALPDGTTTGVPVMEWQSGESTADADETLAAVSDPIERKSAKAKRFLTDFLAKGDKPSDEVLARGHERGLKRNALFEAKKVLDIDAYRQGGIWWWGRQRTQAAPPPDDRQEREPGEEG